MKHLKRLLVFTFTLFTISVFSQDKKLTIKVVDKYSKAVPGAVILFDDVKQRRVANLNGIFKVRLQNEPEVIAAFSPRIGITKLRYKGEEELTIVLKKDDYVPDTPNGKMVNPIQFRDIYDYLRGKVAGVNIGINNQIVIRGVGNWQGRATPLFVLNGVIISEQSFSQIVPTTILSVKVLKGPEAARWGLQGANGVIEVKTDIE